VSVDRGPAGSLDKVEAILSNPALYELASAVPQHPRPGRPRSYPDFMVIVFAALISVWRSARQVEAELAHPVVWRWMRRIVAERFPDDPAMHLPARPMRRHHYTYLRDRYLTDPHVLAELGRLHRQTAVAQARYIGLLDPDGPGSFTHPDLSRMLHADGKVVSPLYRAGPGDVRVDKRTGVVRRRRADPDAAVHFQGDGEAAWGTKFVLVVARSDQGRIILDAEHVSSLGGEASVAMECFGRLVPLAPGTLGVIYDMALRGTHHQQLLRELGIIGVNRVMAEEHRKGTGSGWKGVRIEKSVHVEDRVRRLGDGTTTTIRLFARAGAIGIVEFSESGTAQFIALKRKRIHRNRLKDGRFAWYQDYVLPAAYGGGTITVRLHANDEDAARGLNRPENVRAIPPADRDFFKLYQRRNDSESLNRLLEDSLYIGRAHSLGHARQQVEIFAWALLVNALTLARRAQHSLPLTA
jgi:hypothetical protein